MAEEIAWLRVDALHPWGALLEDGSSLPRDQQTQPLRVGQGVLVYVYHDERQRLCASMRLNDFLSDAATGLVAGDRVSLVVAHPTDLGVNVVVNDRFWGLIFRDDLFRPVRQGQRLDGWVVRVRPDQKLDVSLRAPGYRAVDPLTDQILARMKAAGGYLALTDRSSPEEVRRALGVSKKHFKQAVGALYKRRRIALERDGIRLLPGTEGQ